MWGSRILLDGLAIFCSRAPCNCYSKAGANSIGDPQQSLKMLKLLRMAKLFRLFRFDRIFLYLTRVLTFFEETLRFRVSDGFTKLSKLFVGTLILVHWIGCFNFFLLRVHDFPPDSWLVYAGLLDKGPLLQWKWSFFKALAQMIMIGFQTPP